MAREGLSLKPVSTAAVPKVSGPRDWFRGRKFFHGWGGGWSGGNASNAEDGSGGKESNGERQMEASLARLPLTSCCAARFLTGHGPLFYSQKWDVSVKVYIK